MASDYPELDSIVGNCGNGADFCTDGLKVQNSGIVRLKCLINNYCPSYGIKEQIQQFVFDTATVQNLPDNIITQISAPGELLDGIFLKEKYVYHTNLLWVHNELLSSNDPAIKQFFYDNTLIKSSNSYIPHYWWDYNGSLFANDCIQLKDYPQGQAQSSYASTNSQNSQSYGAYVSKAKINYPYWTYITQTAASDTQNGIASEVDPQIPMINTVGTADGDIGVHWSVVKRRPVFQGADFFVEIHLGAHEPVFVGSSKPLVGTTYQYLDVRTPVVAGQIPTNGGVIELDENGNLVPNSVSLYDFNNQVYVIIEMGIDDPDHHYFIVIPQKASPIFLHASKSVAMIIKGTTECPYRVITPDSSTPVFSRKLSTYTAASGVELLAQDKLRIRVQNYMGKIVVWFSEHEDQPWVITRTDLLTAPPPPTSPTTPASQTGCASGEDPATYTAKDQPMVVAARKIAIHGGNIKAGFIWGYQNYEPQTSIETKTPVHLMGTTNTLPTVDKVNLLLGYSNIDGSSSDAGYGNYNDLTLPTGNDMKFYQDAGKMEEIVAGEVRDTIIWDASSDLAAPNYFSVLGKGYSPSTSTSTHTGTTPTEIAPGYEWPDQSVAIPPGDEATIALSIRGNDVKPIQTNEPRSTYFYPICTLTSGNFTFPTGDPDVQGGTGIEFVNVITPICTGYAAYIAADGEAWNTTSTSMDVSHHVLRFSEQWAAQDYSKIDHTATLKFQCNRGMLKQKIAPVEMGGTLPMAYVQQTPLIVTDYSDKIAQLTNRTFYVQIMAWYEGSEIFLDKCSNNVQTDNANSIIFTGLCHGGDLTYTNNQRTMDCHVFDLSKVLQDQHFLNSPFFDSVRDFVAVYSILQMSGLKGDENSPAPDVGQVFPSSLLASAVIKARVGDDPFELTYFDGCQTPFSVNVQSYALPGSYNILQQQKFKFRDGDKFWDAITKMAAQAGKVVYFDRFGVMHYEDRSDQIMFQNPGQVTSQDILALVKEQFYSTPRTLPNQQFSQGGTVSCLDAGRLAYNQYTWQLHAGDVFNQIQVVSVTPNGGVIAAGDINLDSLDSPNTAGFVGYCKQLLRMDGVYGSVDAVKATAEQLTASYKPAVSVQWESFGRSYLKALDIVQFTGLDSTPDVNYNLYPMPLRLTNISTDIDPMKNVWWSRYEGEWLFPGPGINWT
jgi:hypothetical protein